jgi:DedD protein
MRSLLDTEEEEDKAPEITLSTASVLGIFFGLVLVCGVFFGFGYSMGRGTEMGTQVIKIAGAPAPAVTEPVETADSTPPVEAAPKPVEAQPTPAPAAPAQSEAGSGNASAEPAKHERPQKPSPALQAALVEQPAAVAATMSAPSGTGQPMVQIAAVARREDADVLVSALRQRGYGVSVRSEPQDKLLHVQVGPFASHSQAVAMKQKLLSDGYNAIIKE